MDVKDANSALLSNYEVFKLLTSVKEESKREFSKRNRADGLSTIVYEALKFLESSPSTVAQSPDVIKEFSRAVAPFRLTKAEKLQILNLRPITPVEIQLVVEECEERLSEEKVNELMGIIARLLPEQIGNNAATSAAIASGSMVDDDTEQNE